MNREELKAHPEYIASLEKIKNYSFGFTFTINWSKIPTAKANALKVLLEDAIKEGYIDFMQTGPGLDMRHIVSTYKRTNKER